MESDLVHVLGKKYSVDILEATSRPRSAKELSSELGIPIATCYRRIYDLAEHDLLEQVDTKITASNRETKLYRRNVDKITVAFADTPSVTTEKRSDISAKLDAAWRSISPLKN